VLELASRIGGDEAALEGALGLLLERNERGLAGSLQDALARRGGGGQSGQPQERVLTLVRQHLARGSGS
jgi:hypothetical protein